MDQRNPDITAASITKMKPQISNSVSFATATQTYMSGMKNKNN